MLPKGLLLDLFSIFRYYLLVKIMRARVYEPSYSCTISSSVLINIKGFLPSVNTFPYIIIAFFWCFYSPFLPSLLPYSSRRNLIEFNEVLLHNHYTTYRLALVYHNWDRVPLEMLELLELIVELLELLVN